MDQYRGRVFAVYDVVVNGGIVAGAIIAALILPPSGISPWLPGVIAVSYILFAAVKLRPKFFNSEFSATS
jgi:hypothetical protein